MSEKSDWEQGYDQAQRRFYEERKILTARIAELEALVERLIEAGDRLSDSLCTYPEEEKTIEVCNWNAIVAEYKECEK